MEICKRVWGLPRRHRELDLLFICGIALISGNSGLRAKPIAGVAGGKLSQLFVAVAHIEYMVGITNRQPTFSPKIAPCTMVQGPFAFLAQRQNGSAD